MSRRYSSYIHFFFPPIFDWLMPPLNVNILGLDISSIISTAFALSEILHLKHCVLAVTLCCSHHYTSASLPVCFPCFLRAAAAKSLQSCPTLCDPTEGSPPSSPVPGILQARTLEWVAISFSNAGKWKVKSLSRSVVSNSSQPHGLQPTRLLRP